MKIYLDQASPVVGDLDGNARRLQAAIRAGAQAGARVVLSPELAICGYPPRDLLFRSDFVPACRRAAERVAEATRGTSVIAVYGAPWESGGRRNSAIVARNGEIVAVRHKSLLPNYDVFDEVRWFVPETAPRPVVIEGLTLGVTICEDIWNEPSISGVHYAVDPMEALRGADLHLNLSASPFHAGKARTRTELLSRQARQAQSPLAYCNQVGGNDELVFDGASMVIGADGEVRFQAPAFVDGGFLVDLASPVVEPTYADWEAEVFEALVVGTRDYARRCGFSRALVGLSGGIDSAVVAVIAARALGPENVWGVGLPGPFSSAGSVTDARALAHNLGIRFDVVPIHGVHEAFLSTLAGPLAGRAPDVTEENLQARARGTILMALSNKFGHLVLTTGNKSEMAVGYCTLYGDMNGGLAVLADVYKTDVYRLARWLNRGGELIPRSTIEKPPSAELAPGQTDQDSLPPYAELDAILRDYVDGDLDVPDLLARGHDRATVERVVRMVARSEYKRGQAAPALRVSQRAFGVGRRVPIAQRWS